MSGLILSLNAGSSSIEFALFDMADGEPIRHAHGQIENIGIAPHLIAHDADGAPAIERRWSRGVTHAMLMASLLDWVEEHGARDLVAVGHRVVHGGPDFWRPVRIDEAVLMRLDALIPLAPLHQPHNLSAIRAVAAARPDLPQVACFDTGFHHAQPAVATCLALPEAIRREGVRRYGFHGISYEYLARRLRALDPVLARGRVIAAHLGNGASLCAMRDGESVDTTMGFTALDGLVMGTRCGGIDPGVILYLIEQKGMSAQRVEHMLYSESGLLAVSGLSSDMRALLASDDPRAAEAIDLFCYRVAREAGGLVSSLGGLDGLIFSAGIGEHAPAIRARVCERLGWLGVRLDAEANGRGDACISTADSRVTVRVIPTDEERMIALHTAKTAGTALVCPT